jgi:transcriptional regulator with XRE-family HTH domain
MTDQDTPGTDEADEHRLVGSRLREARDVLGLTQEDVASALRIPRTSVIAMEAGRRKVTGLELRRLARLYRRDVGWLLGDDPEASEVVGADALFRATASLTDEDREQVLRFAEFLASGGPRRIGGPARPAPEVSRGARRGRPGPDDR